MTTKPDHQVALLAGDGGLMCTDGRATHGWPENGRCPNCGTKVVTR